jgi:hypothetical protein
MNVKACKINKVYTFLRRLFIEFIIDYLFLLGGPKVSQELEGLKGFKPT